MILFGWMAVFFLWTVCASFVISGILMILAVIHHRKDREIALILGVIIPVFAMFAAGAAWAALAVGRCL